MKAEYYPEHDAEIAAQLKTLWPETLQPNRLLNVILDICRGGYNIPWDKRVEAIDQLTWAHLGVSEEWDEAMETASFEE